MSKPQKIESLEAIARGTVGDDKTPDLFFVTDQGAVVTITRDFNLAYARWNELACRFPKTECALENRTVGVLASIEPESDGSTKLIRIDDTRMLCRSYWR